MSSVHKKKQGGRRRKEGEYEVDKIIGKKVEDGKVHYQIQWIGFPPSQSSWEPVENLINCQDIVSAFEKEHKAGKQGEAQMTARQDQRRPEERKGDAKGKGESRNASLPKVGEESGDRGASKTQQGLSKATNAENAGLCTSKVQELFEKHIKTSDKTNLKASRAETATAAEPASKGRNKMAVSQVSSYVKSKKDDPPKEQAAVKRSLASHLSCQNEEYEPEISQNLKGRKVSRRLNYVDEPADSETATKPTSNQEISEKFIQRFSSKGKGKRGDFQEKPTTFKETQKGILAQSEGQKGQQRESSMLKTLKIEEQTKNGKKNGQKQPQVDKLTQSRVLGQVTQEIQADQAPLSGPALKEEGQLFKHMERYSRLDEYLILHKRMAILNILNKDQGGKPEKPKIKLVEVGDYGGVEEQLNQLKKVTRKTSIEKMESLLKLKHGWVAVAKNSAEGLFMMDVNLLHENVWKVIENTYNQQ